MIFYQQQLTTKQYNCHLVPHLINMHLVYKSMLKYGTVQQSPMHRISAMKILQNVESHQITHQMINNARIAMNCSIIALRYSKCYLCRFWPIRSTIRMMYQANEHDKILAKIEEKFVDQCPIPKYKPVFKRFTYENKGIYAALSLMQSGTLTPIQQQIAIQFLTALELVNLGFSLHHSIGKSHKLNLATRIALKMMSKQMKDSYLVLGGDYFHIKGSVLASETNNIQLSKLLSEVEIDLCKYVHLTEQLKSKIIQKGYDKVEIKQIYNISVLKTSPVVKGLASMDIIKGQTYKDPAIKKEVYQIVGLLLLYRRDLQNFMFNFKQILKKYMEYTANRINFDCEQSLPYFIFFQGAQNNKRIDTSYLNTVTMMGEEIQYLKKRLTELIGDQEANQLQSKMKYYFMIYS